MVSSVWSRNAEAPGHFCMLLPGDSPEPVQGGPETEHICVLSANTSVCIWSLREGRWLVTLAVRVRTRGPLSDLCAQHGGVQVHARRPGMPEKAEGQKLPKAFPSTVAALLERFPQWEMFKALSFLFLPLPRSMRSAPWCPTKATTRSCWCCSSSTSTWTRRCRPSWMVSAPGPRPQSHLCPALPEEGVTSVHWIPVRY